MLIDGISTYAVMAIISLITLYFVLGDFNPFSHLIIHIGTAFIALMAAGMCIFSLLPDIFQEGRMSFVTGFMVSAAALGFLAVPSGNNFKKKKEKRAERAEMSEEQLVKTLNNCLWMITGFIVIVGLSSSLL